MNEDEYYRLYWTKDEILKLISLVHQHPQLYDSKHEHFRDQFQKNLAYDTISYEMGVDHEVVKKKINALCSQYIVELKELENNNTQLSVWPYFDAMKIFNKADLETYVYEETVDYEGKAETIIMEIHENNSSSDEDDASGTIKKRRINEDSNTIPYKWNKSKTFQLIEIYQSYPELYNSNCADYRNNYKRKLALENVAQQMDTTVAVIKKKIHALRTLYTSELKKMKKKNSTQPRWAFFEALKFLYDEAYYTPRPKYNVGEVISETNDDNLLEDIIEYTLETDDEETQYVDIDNESFSSLTTKEMQQPTVANCVNCEQNDEFTRFGECVAKELRLTQDHEDIHNLLKAQIMKAIHDARELMAELKD